MKRATSNLILAGGALVALGWVVRPQLAKAPPSIERRTEARKSMTTPPSRVMERLIERAAFEPEAACNAAAIEQPDALPAVLALWAESDPAAAERWALAQSGKLRQKALGILALEAARGDLESAGRIAAMMEDDSERAGVWSFVAAQWAAEDAEGAMQWLREMPAGEMRSDVERRVIPAVASNHPELAAGYMDDEMSDAALQRTVAPEIVGRWAQMDPVAAGAWIERWNNAEMRDSCLHSLLGVWNTRDSVAVQNWVHGLPESDFRDQAGDILSSLSP